MQKNKKVLNSMIWQTIYFEDLKIMNITLVFYKLSTIKFIRNLKQFILVLQTYNNCNSGQMLYSYVLTIKIGKEF